MIKNTLEKQQNYKDFKQYLANTLNPKPLTLDLDRANMQKALGLAGTIAKEFNTSVSVYRTRRMHYQLEADFMHTLLDNIIIRLLSNDDMFRLQFDTVRMFNKADSHNTLFAVKMRIDGKKAVLDRKRRKLIKVVMP